MRILITGGAGFIGSNLALHLRSFMGDAEIVCMDNLYRRGSELNVPRLIASGIRFQHGDIRQPSDFPKIKFDFLIECSAEPSVLAGRDGSPDYLFQTNVVGAFNCLETARHTGARLIFLSTSRVYTPLRHWKTILGRRQRRGSCGRMWARRASRLAVSLNLLQWQEPAPCMGSPSSQPSN